MSKRDHLCGFSLGKNKKRSKEFWNDRQDMLGYRGGKVSVAYAGPSITYGIVSYRIYTRVVHSACVCYSVWVYLLTLFKFNVQFY